MSTTDLGAVDEQAFTATRLSVHWAAQFPAAVGLSLVPKAPDWSHGALRFEAATGTLASAPSPHGVVARLHIADLLVSVERDGTRHELALPGRPFDAAYQWLKDTVAALDVDAPIMTRDVTKMPAHPVAQGAAFTFDVAQAALLVAWFTVANAALDRFTAGLSGNVSPVYVWPHHLDCAALLTVRKGQREDQEDARTVGFGMTPGDDGDPQPYVYVTPWPRPAPDALPPLSGPGSWHTEGWVGAVLRAPDLAGRDAASTIDAFLAHAHAAALRVVNDAA